MLVIAEHRLQFVHQPVDEHAESLVVPPARLSSQTLDRIRSTPRARAEELDGSRAADEGRETLIERDVAGHEQVVVREFVQDRFHQLHLIVAE